MYVRPKVNGKVTTLGVSGLLWRDALVMYDRESRSLWSQILGRAIEGPATGLKLQELPSQLTTWKDWVARHPDTLVLQKPPLATSSYDFYHRNLGMIGVNGSPNPDKRIKGKTLVFAMERGDDSAVTPFPFLWKSSVVNVEAFETPIVVAAQRRQPLAFAFERTVGDRVLTFEAPDSKNQMNMRDKETGSTWDWEKGVATDGELAGTELIRVPGTAVYWGIWAQYHEDTVVIDTSQ